MQYSWPYVLVGIVLIVFSLLWTREQEATRKKYYVIASVALLVFFLCLRGFVCDDWENYYPFFQRCTLADTLVFFNGDIDAYEPGYALLNVICKWIFPNYHFFVFIIGILDLYLLLRFAKNRIDNVPLLLLLFLVFDGISISFNLQRNFIAILIYLNALPFLEQRKPIPYFLLCLLAISFHVSSMFYLPIYFFFHKYPSKWLYLSIFIICNVIFLLRISIVEEAINLMGLGELMQDKIITYTETFDSSRLISIGFLERTITGVLIFLFYDKLKEKRNGNGIYINAIIVYFIFYDMFGEFKEMSTRLSYLFVYGYWIIWMDFMVCFMKPNNRTLFTSFVYIYCVLRLLTGCRDPDFKYENILFGSSTYQERMYYHNKNSIYDSKK